MADKKFLRLTCPVCETKLKFSDDITRFACLNCGTELTVVGEGGIATLEVVAPAEGGAALTPHEQELIQINSQIRAKDDSYGVGCALATMGIAGVACISILIASALKLTIMAGITIVIALFLLAAVVLLFIITSNRETQPLLRRRNVIQGEIEKKTEEEISPLEPVTPSDQESIKEGLTSENGVENNSLPEEVSKELSNEESSLPRNET